MRIQFYIEIFAIHFNFKPLYEYKNYKNFPKNIKLLFEKVLRREHFSVTIKKIIVLKDISKFYFICAPTITARPISCLDKYTFNYFTVSLQILIITK